MGKYGGSAEEVLRKFEGSCGEIFGTNGEMIRKALRQYWGSIVEVLGHFLGVPGKHQGSTREVTGKV